jgi:hypothetical protein
VGFGWQEPNRVPRCPSTVNQLISGSALAFAALLSSAHGQPADSGAFTAKLLQNRYALSIRNGQFTGTAATVLKSAIAQSQFVLVGETHGLADTPMFWTAVCNTAGPQGFRTMAIEEGPLVAASLEQLARHPDTEPQLAAFEKRYPESLNIYNTREEFQMLQRCAASAGGSNFRLWGLNQEGLGAAGLILDRILDTKPSGEVARALRQLRQKNDDAYAKAVQSGKISDLFMIAADDAELAAVARLLEKEGTPQARSLFASLIRSHEINRAWPADSGRRSRLMKTLFTADYDEAARSQPAAPKVLLKFGAFHIYRGHNPMHDTGIGNYVAEFAEGHGAQSVHISLMAVKGASPMFGGVGRPPRGVRPFNLQEDPRSRYLQPILANLLESDWTVFDLRPLRDDLRRRPDLVNSELAELIFGMDLLVMVPEATPSTHLP